ncbi:MAG: hypothetical protein RLZ10_16 [Bacteroidota bacterium]|jgi:hypothetical protein
MSRKKGEKKENPNRFKFEFILNKTAVDHHLTRPSKVGPTIELLYQHNPKTIQEWAEVFYKNSVQKKKDGSGIKVDENYLNSVGDELFRLLNEKIFPLILLAKDELTIEDCRNFIKDVVIRRSFEGFIAEKDIVNQVEIALDGDIEFTKDAELEPINVDAYGKSKKYGKTIGLSVKPQSYKKQDGFGKDESLKKSWEKWERENNSKIFIVYYSEKKDGQKKIIKEKDELINQILLFLTN